MLKENRVFEEGGFALRVLSVGSYIDDGCGNGKLYQVEATTVRLNPAAYNEWLLCHTSPDRDVYETAGEWEAAKLENTKRFDAWTKSVLSALGLCTFTGSVCVTNAHAEVFTVVHIWQVAPEVMK